MFEAIQSFDLAVILWMRDYHAPIAITVAWVVANLANKGWLWWVIAAGSWTRGSRTFAAHVASALAIATIAGFPLKSIIARTRPGEFASQQFNVALPELATTAHSFPSGHTLLAAAFAFVVARYYKGWRAWMAAIFVVAVGLARVYQGMHWPSDVIGSIVLGAVSAWAGGKVIEMPAVRNFIEPKQKQVQLEQAKETVGSSKS